MGERHRRSHSVLPRAVSTQEYLAATVAFRPIGLDLCGPVLAPCLLGCAGTGR
jgi:hypothetical protein